MGARSFKDVVNSALYRGTGYMLTRETPAEREQAIRQAAGGARKRTAERYQRLAAEREARRKERAAQLRAQAEARKAEWEARREEELRRKDAERQAEAERRTEERDARIARGDDLPNHYDEGMRRMIARVRPRTMTHHRKLQALIDATRYVVREQIPGDIVECGVWRGGSMQAVALTLLEQGDTTRELHLFDTFEGMPPPTEHDARTTDGEATFAKDLLAASGKDSWMWAIADIDDVQRGMSEIEYPAGKVHYHPGLVEETTPGQAPKRIAILRLDTDWYASTLHELEVLYDRLSPGGVLIIDDYEDWDGARKATEEWLGKLRQPLFLAPMASGRIAMKPFDTGADADPESDGSPSSQPRRVG